MSTQQFAEITAEQAEAFMPVPEIQPVRARLAEMVGSNFVVDVGCGKGDEVSDLFTREQYCGIDCSAELIRIAKRNNPRYRFFCRSAVDVTLSTIPLPFGTSCHFAIVKAVFEHLPTEEALAIYNHLKEWVPVMLVAWHTEPGTEELTTYDGELGVMQQNRHDRKLFKGVMEREVCGKHVIWQVV